MVRRYLEQTPLRGPLIRLLPLSSLAVLIAATVAPPSAAPGPTLAMLSTPVGGERTTLRFQPTHPGAPLADVSAELTHRPDAVVLGAVLPGTRTVLATALTAPERDVSWASTLFRLEAGQPAQPLVDRVYAFTRPLVTPAGRVFVLRGTPGPDPTDDSISRGELRSDLLTVDEVDPRTAAVRTVYSTKGYLAFLAGALRSELVVYRVDPSGAELLAVQVDTGSTRLLTKLAPFARDFSVDSTTGTLYFTQLSSDGVSWQVEALQLASGAREVRVSHQQRSASPHAWPAGGLLHSEGEGGLLVLGSSGPRTARRPAGVDVVSGFSSDLAWAIGLHQLEGVLPEPLLLRTATLEAEPVPSVAGERVDLAGFVDEGAGR